MKTMRSKIIKTVKEIILAFLVIFGFLFCMMYALDIGITRVEKAHEHANP